MEFFTLIMVDCVALYAAQNWGMQNSSQFAATRMNALGTALILAALQQIICCLLASPMIHFDFMIVSSLLFIIIAAVASIHYAAMFYFGHGAIAVRRHLPFNFQNRPSLRAVLAYARQYLPFKYFVFTGICFLTFNALSAVIAPPKSISLPLIIISSVAGMLVMQRHLFYRLRSGRGLLLAGERAIMAQGRKLRVSPLYHAARTQNISTSPVIKYLPETIVIIVNESVGRNMPASNGEGTFAEALKILSGNGSDWLVPGNAVSNSSCTDVSLPSILTGCGAHETIEKLHKLPFIFDLAKHRDYKTMFFTSSSLRWAGFEPFFAAASIDDLFTAESSAAPFINDLTVDDMLPAYALARRIRHDKGRLCAVLYNNALHVPYQNETVVTIPDELTDRRSRALHILQEVHSEIFQALHLSGRYEDALIFLIGDHGEMPSVNAASTVRLTHLTDDVVFPLFMIKPPRDLPISLRKALAENQNALIANLDIVPTIAGLLGVGCAQEKYAGRDLCQPIEEERLAYMCNINEWRSWPRGAAAVFQGSAKLIADYQNRALSHFTDTSANNFDKHEALLAQVLDEKIMMDAFATILNDKWQRA